MTLAGMLFYLKKLAADSRRAVHPAPHRPSPANWSDHEITAAWLGHSTVLLNFLGIWILTDPVLSQKIGLRFGPFTVGPKRYREAALSPREIPPLDLILLSHAHMDHLDLWTLKQLRQNCAVITAGATGDLIPRGFRAVQELDWGETAPLDFGPGKLLTLEAFEVQHWGARMRSDHHRRYNGYLLSHGDRRICFAGDTAATGNFRALRSRGGIDLMMVPIGAYQPWIRSHCTPEQAVAMADDAGARTLLPIHHQTFKLSFEPMDEPIQRFEAALAADPARIALREIGQTWRSGA